MIKINDLCFSYTSLPPYMLDEITLEVASGEYLSVLGENGCGKSTLIKIILNFLKPTKGYIISEARRIGYVSQKNDFSNTSFPITVFEMLNSYRKLVKSKNKDVVMEYLEQIGLASYKDALIGTLSGGQHQKILIARALIGKPDLLILDEPSTGIDINSQKEIYGLLKRLNQENGMTIIAVEHNINAAVSNSTHMYHLSKGHGHICTPEKYIAEYLNDRKGTDIIA